MEECLICLNPLRSSRPRGPSELPCGHNFHRRCIEEWRQTSSTCPTCRHPLRPSTSPARRRPSTISSDGHFYVLLPPAFHIDAIAATHGFRLHHTRIGEIACFCCDGSVREQLRELQRIGGATHRWCNASVAHHSSCRRSRECEQRRPSKLLCTLRRARSRRHRRVPRSDWRGRADRACIHVRSRVRSAPGTRFPAARSAAKTAARHRLRRELS